MRWPLVWRATYDEAYAAARLLEQELHASRALHVEAQRMCNELLALLKPPPPLPVATRILEPLSAPPRDEIAEAIDLSAGTDKALARHLGRWAKQQQLEGAKEHDIIQAIIHWHNANEWDGEDEPGYL